MERRKPEGSVEEDSSVEFISTGCIPLNLAASQKGKDGGHARGRIVNLVGDGSSGKTLLALEALAWAYYNIRNIKSKIYPEIKKLYLVYNNSEGVMDFPVAKMFGKEFFDAVEWTYLDTCQGFGRDIQSRITKLKDGECLIYVQDSVDATISEEAKARIDKSVKDDKPEDGSFGTEKAKYFSQSFFNRVCSLQQGKDATLILISQVRENLNAGTFGKKFYRTGGKALDFYTHQVAWLYRKEKLKKTFDGNDRIYGIRVLAKYERNKTAIPFREAEFMVRFDYGVDDVQSMLDFMYGPKDKEIEWNEKKMKVSDLRRLADDDKAIYEELVRQTEEYWAKIEKVIKTTFKPKY